MESNPRQHPLSPTDSPGTRIIAARDSLYDLLGASNAAEGEVIRYLIRALPIEAVELLAAMAERQVKRATADAFERGFTEGVEHARAQHAAGINPERWDAGEGRDGGASR